MLTAEEAARRLRVSPESVRRWARQGRLRAVKVGRQLRITPAEVDRILANGLDAPRPPEADRGAPSHQDPPQDDPPEGWPKYRAYHGPAPEREELRVIGEW